MDRARAERIGLVEVDCDITTSSTNEAGEVTSHLQGLWYRTIKFVEAGIKPVYVFDGKPPELKRAQLDQRLGRREEADKGLEAAKEAGDAEAIERYSKIT
jgi:flap endonuclease-1